LNSCCVIQQIQVIMNKIFEYSEIFAQQKTISELLLNTFRYISAHFFIRFPVFCAIADSDYYTVTDAGIFKTTEFNSDKASEIKLIDRMLSDKVPEFIFLPSDISSPELRTCKVHFRGVNGECIYTGSRADLSSFFKVENGDSALYEPFIIRYDSDSDCNLRCFVQGWYNAGESEAVHQLQEIRNLIRILSSGLGNIRQNSQLSEPGKYQSVFENHTDGMLFADIDFRIMFLNRRVLDMTIYNNCCDLYSYKVPDLFEEPERPVLESLLNQLVSDEKEVRTCCRIRENGAPMPVELTAWINRTSDDSTKFIAVRLRDITAEKEKLQILERTLEVQNILLNRSMELLNLPPENYNEQIDELIMIVCDYTGFDRSYVVSYDLENGNMTCTHEWSGIRGLSLSDEIGVIHSLKGWSGLLSSHLKGEWLLNVNPHDFPDQSSFGKILLSQSVKTMMAIPLMDGERCTGFVGFDSFEEKDQTDGEKILIFQFLAEMLSSAKSRLESITTKETEFRQSAALMEGSFDGIAIISEDHSILQLNQKFASMLGYDRDALTGVKIWELDNKHDSSRIKEIFKDSSESGGLFETRYKRKDDSVFDAEVSISRSRIHDNSIFITVIRDITKRKEEEKIKQFHTNIARAAITSDDLTAFLTNVKYELSELIDDTNFFVALYDKSADEFYSVFYSDEFDVIERWDAERSMSGLIMKFSQPLLFTREDILRLNSEGKIRIIGTLPEVWFGVPLVVKNNFIGVMAVQSYHNKNAFNDNHRYFFETAARQLSLFIEFLNAELLSRTLSKAVSQSSILVVITDESGMIKYHNPGFSLITENPGTDLTDKNLCHSILLSDDVKYNFEISDIFNSEKEWKGEIKILTGGDEPKWFEVVLSPVFDSGGKLKNWVALLEDITEMKALFSETLLARDKAEELNHIKNSLFANMSHEFRTPLIGILGAAEIIEELGENDMQIKELAGYIKGGGLRLKNTLELLLSMWEIESGKINSYLKLENQNLVTLLNDVFSLAMSEAMKKNLECVFTCAEPEVVASVDEEFFRLMFTHILGNAIKYTDTGFIRMELKKTDTQAVIEVEDSGCGIPEEKQEIIWEEFRQASEGLSRIYEGTGLGLTAAKKYCELMGGKINLKSEKGKGTVFTITFPLPAT